MTEVQAIALFLSMVAIGVLIIAVAKMIGRE